MYSKYREQDKNTSSLGGGGILQRGFTVLRKYTRTYVPCWAEIPGLEGTLLWLMPVLHPHCNQQEWVGLLRGILQFSLVYWTKRVTVWVADPSFEQLPVP